MRAHGSLTELPEAGPADHVCWVHDGDEEFEAAVREFLAGGLARGERLLCVGDGAIAPLADADVVLGDVAALLADGVLETMTVAEAYAASGAFTAERQRAFYEAATQRALADGYQGLRVVAELSEFAASPEHREELVRWEHVADEFMASGSGMSALCAYGRHLPPGTLADALAVHPQVHAPTQLTPFRLFFDGDHLALAGSVDTFTADRLAALLAGSPTGATAVLDLAALEFIDVAGCRALAGWAATLRTHGVPLEIRSAPPLLRRMWRILGLDDVAPVGFATAC